jgi:hypothetical protein
MLTRSILTVAALVAIAACGGRTVDAMSQSASSGDGHGASSAGTSQDSGCQGCDDTTPVEPSPGTVPGAKLSVDNEACAVTSVNADVYGDGTPQWYAWVEATCPSLGAVTVHGTGAIADYPQACDLDGGAAYDSVELAVVPNCPEAGASCNAPGPATAANGGSCIISAGPSTSGSPSEADVAFSGHVVSGGAPTGIGTHSVMFVYLRSGQ